MGDEGNASHFNKPRPQLRVYRSLDIGWGVGLSLSLAQPGWPNERRGWSEGFFDGEDHFPKLQGNIASASRPLSRLGASPVVIGGRFLAGSVSPRLGEPSVSPSRGCLAAVRSRRHLPFSLLRRRTKAGLPLSPSPPLQPGSRDRSLQLPRGPGTLKAVGSTPKGGTAY